uniref:Uncharacterized protein n=1 Tax=Oryza punctata TaxID=4537 RepID=A0A0E0LKH2_ORYPU
MACVMEAMLELVVRPSPTHSPRRQSREADTRPHRSPPRHLTPKRLDRSSAALSSKSASISVFPVAATHGQGHSDKRPPTPTPHPPSPTPGLGRLPNPFTGHSGTASPPANGASSP